MSPEPRSPKRLPVLELVGRLGRSLADGRSAILTAPPGTGKSTALPPALLESVTGRVLVTQPRRLAARMLATHVARKLDTDVGGRVGYAVRGDRREGRDTRILYVTEGLLLRRLMSGGGLSPDDVVVLDEFHERSIDADLLLGLLRLRKARFVIASATLDAAGLADRLGLEVFGAEDRLHPVRIEHRRAPSADEPWSLAAEAVARVVRSEDDDGGDILVFMPGRREIDRTVEACAGIGGVEVVPLHGGLPPRAQDRAVAAEGPRRIVVATNIAETSITIPRVTVVVDSGLARIDRFDAVRETSRLVTEPIDRGSAVQRAGRAGRVAPGRCIRLYTESEFLRRAEGRIPATARADLADAFLRLHAAGVSPRDFDWLDPPPEASFTLAERTLHSIEAVRDERVTEVGRALARLPLPPRIGRFLLDALEAGGGRFAVAAAVVLAERDFASAVERRDQEGLLVGDEPSGDLSWRARLLLDASASPRGVDPPILRDARRTVSDLVGQLRVDDDGLPEAVVPALVRSLGDRIAFRRPDRDTCLLPGRKHAVIDRRSRVPAGGFLVAGEVRGLETRGEGTTVLSLATGIEESSVDALLGDRLGTAVRFEFDPDRRLMTRWVSRTFDGLEIDPVSQPIGPDARAAAAAAMLAMIEAGDIEIPGWDEDVEEFIERTRRTAEWYPERGIPVFDDDDLAVMRAEVVGGHTRLDDLPGSSSIIEVLRSALDWADAEFVDRMAPRRISLPGGRSMGIRWKAGEPPRGSARIGDLVGLEATPRVAGGRVPILLEILAPNRRPVQVTDDLPGFWDRTYPTIKKELKRRYPRHPWP